MSARPQEAIVGDWDGSAARAQIDAVEQLADLQRQVRSACVDMIEHRDRWAKDPTAAGRIRAVAYQTCTSRLLRVLDTQRGDDPAREDVRAATLAAVADEFGPEVAASMEDQSPPCQTHSHAGSPRPVDETAEPFPVIPPEEKRPLGWLFRPSQQPSRWDRG